MLVIWQWHFVHERAVAKLFKKSYGWMDRWKFGRGFWNLLLLFGMYMYVYIVLLPEKPSEIASEVGISRLQGGVLVIVFN